MYVQYTVLSNGGKCTEFNYLTTSQFVHHHVLCIRDSGIPAMIIIIDNRKVIIKCIKGMSRRFYAYFYPSDFSYT